MSNAPAPPFRTSDLDAAAYLRALKFPLLTIERGAGRSTFHFRSDAANAVAGFYSGGAICAQDYASALRELKKAIHAGPTNTNANEVTHDNRPVR